MTRMLDGGRKMGFEAMIDATERIQVQGASKRQGVHCALRLDVVLVRIVPNVNSAFTDTVFSIAPPRIPLRLGDIRC
jgi:hypothetical protein